jgi:hypothetical protein
MGSIRFMAKLSAKKIFLVMGLLLRIHIYTLAKILMKNSMDGARFGMIMEFTEVISKIIKKTELENLQVGMEMF